MRPARADRASAADVPQRARLEPMGVLPVALVACLVLLQGGYFAYTSCAVGLLTCVFAAVVWWRRKGVLPARTCMALLGLALAYVASAFVHGPTLTSLSEVGAWALAPAFALLVAAQTGEQRGTSLRLLGWLGLVTTALGVLNMAGLVNIAAGVEDGRLQSTFQYANAAGIWYGVTLLLCLLSEDARQRSLIALPFLCLLLTQSGGVLIATVVPLLAVVVRDVRDGRWETAAHVLVEMLAAVLAFVAAGMLPGLGIVAVYAVLMAVCLLVGHFEDSVLAHLRLPRLVCGATVVLAAASAVGLRRYTGRLVRATETFVERLWQVRDGIRIWSTRPVLGIGPDEWQFVYAYHQSAPYHTGVVHCAPVQTLVDAGVVGLAFLVAFVVLGMRALVRGRREGDCLSRAALVAASALLLHALIDFDLRFGALKALLFLLVVPPLRAQGAEAAAGLKQSLVRRLAVPVTLCVSLLLCVIGLLCQTSLTSLSISAARGDYSACERLFEGSPLAQSDAEARESYFEALYQQKRYPELVAAYDLLEYPTDADAFYAALSCYASADVSQGALILIEQLERKPYDEAMLASVLTVVDGHRIDASLQERFDAAVERARRLSGRS